MVRVILVTRGLVEARVIVRLHHRRLKEITRALRRRHSEKLNLDGLTPFEKNFYVESPSVAAMSESEVEEYKWRREITVEGKDVPKPVKAFQDVGFPGITAASGFFPSWNSRKEVVFFL
ncbi:Uncharacterized protein Fot_48770 [Forsythia ovata]|uniref:Uncharacterized protein n=1 Tax=Forsythia ovata TaxID=205694 RepID=A0ABD1QDA9_9LAMI